MFTWRSWLKLMRSLEPHKRVKVLTWLGILYLCLTPVFLIGWETDPEPIGVPWPRIPATLSSNVKTWDYDHSLYTFAVKHKTPEGKTHKVWLYSNKALFDAANITPTTPLFVDIENTKSSPAVSRLVTEKGVSLYDPSLRAQTIKTNNLKAMEPILFFSVLGLLSFAGAGVLHYKNKRHDEAQTGAS
ncbi:hypothetical protein [Pseudomonas sp. Teo4]|uniref:hypothetical protein n=1 Tax=Pseudomonas sp. Teo4 TaxID=3064528 RepID=UPI002ABBA61C|nr:hypothetical protein [Pseudomonas sp. Teo4]MDZ3996246.1 hypothetical protein [Pseudomonas sp. Teo4]